MNNKPIHQHEEDNNFIDYLFANVDFMNDEIMECVFENKIAELYE